MASLKSNVITVAQQNQVLAYLCTSKMTAYSSLYHGSKRRNSHIDLDIGWRAEIEVNHSPNEIVEIDAAFQRMLDAIKYRKSCVAR